MIDVSDVKSASNMNRNSFSISIPKVFKLNTRPTSTKLKRLKDLYHLTEIKINNNWKEVISHQKTTQLLIKFSSKLILLMLKREPWVEWEMNKVLTIQLNASLIVQLIM
jgi:hypothetical protein